MYWYAALAGWDRAACEAAINAAIHAAAIEALIGRVEADVGAAFAPEALKLLAELQEQDRGAFELLRVKLKKRGVRLTALDKALAEAAGPDDRDTTQAGLLLEIASEAELFHTADRTAYADIEVDDHRETWRLRSKNFRRWLTRSYFEKYGSAPNSDAMVSALAVIEARADFGAPEREVFVRIGSHDGKLYLDLCDEAWRAVEITAAGWRVVTNPPVRFRRAPGMKPLPVPVSAPLTSLASLNKLRALLNVGGKSERPPPKVTPSKNGGGADEPSKDFVLAIAWLLAALRDRGPYPILALTGEQGSAKSTFSAILRALLDPNTAPLRALPHEDRDLFIAASNGHVLAFDNVSGLPPWISDTMCRLATGGGFAVRQLYSDDDEMLFDAMRPQIVNGIEDMMARPDLADRSLFFLLEPIPEEDRRPEAELWAAFNEAHPCILGALLDAAATGLKRLPEARLEKLPRMADFATWVAACETALWPAGTFMTAYDENLDEAVGNVIEADLVAAAVRDFMATRTKGWEGTAAQLLPELAELVGERAARSKRWPDATRLSGRLRRAATNLRKIGIETTFKRGHSRKISISRVPPKEGESATPATQNDEISNNNNNVARAASDGLSDASATQTAISDANSGLSDAAGDACNPLKNKDCVAGVANDADFPSFRGAEKEKSEY